MKFTPHHPFGDALAYDVPAGATVVILALQTRRGLVPIRLCLPHQVYRDTLTKLLDDNPEADGVCVIPANHMDYVLVERAALAVLPTTPEQEADDA